MEKYQDRNGASKASCWWIVMTLERCSREGRSTDDEEPNRRDAAIGESWCLAHENTKVRNEGNFEDETNIKNSNFEEEANIKNR